MDVALHWHFTVFLTISQATFIKQSWAVLRDERSQVHGNLSHLYQPSHTTWAHRVCIFMKWHKGSRTCTALVGSRKERMILCTCLIVGSPVKRTTVQHICLSQTYFEETRKDLFEKLCQFFGVETRNLWSIRQWKIRPIYPAYLKSIDQANCNE